MTKGKMHCCTCKDEKEDIEVFWGQDCNACRDTKGKSHGCYIPSLDFSKIDETHALFANIIRPHHYLRTDAKVEIIYWDGGLTGVYVRGAISKSGRKVGGYYGMWIPMRSLSNYRIRYSYLKQIKKEG